MPRVATSSSAKCKTTQTTLILSAVILSAAVLGCPQTAWSQTAGNRLTYLDHPCDPYYVGQHFPKLTTPQWVGEEGVDAVVILAIDDMRDPRHYEAYLRPILNRLKELDGRAPVSIMTNSVDPEDPQLATWIEEGLTIDIHTIDHPCPCLTNSDFAASLKTYADCVDLMNRIPGNHPTTFRMPCCDSLNTPSPRFWMEIFNRTTEQGHFLQADSSVFQMFTPLDADLNSDTLVEENGELRFGKYVPFPSFANTIENYPYPYVIGEICWEFPCAVPSDWQAQNLHQPNNPKTVEDMKVALDLTVEKQGVMNLVFHPHNWLRSDQIVELIDHAAKAHGRRVKFLTFHEALERMNQHLLGGQPIRDLKTGAATGVRLLDLNDDGYIDVVGAGPRGTRIWQPDRNAWKETETPFEIGPASRNTTWKYSTNSMQRRERYGIGPGNIVQALGRPVESAEGEQAQLTLYDFAGETWQPSGRSSPVSAANTDVKNRELVLAGLFRDIDGDGISEWLYQRSDDVVIRSWQQETWAVSPASIPTPWRLFPEDPWQTDSGLRFVDLNQDQREDLVASNEDGYGAWLFDSETGNWSTELRTGERGDSSPGIPPISRAGTNNGAWFLKQTLWVQNEDTARLPDLVDRISFESLLTNDDPFVKNAGMPKPLEPQAALQSLKVDKGLLVDLVVSEPLIADPVAFDWDAQGRLWVVEMSDYPLGVDGQGTPGGRVRVLWDRDGDGQYDTSKVFLDEVPFPTGIKVWKEGVVISTAPSVFMAYDRDGDHIADEIETLFTGFGEGNQQHRVNGLRYGLDHRLYLANGDSGGSIQSTKTGEAIDISGRDLWIHPETGAMGTTTGQTQFGRNRNDWQDWFGGNNSNPMWHYVVDERYIARNPHARYPVLRNPVSEQPGTSRVYPISQTLARYNDFQMANRFTSACSPNVYRDDRLGATFSGNALICEPVHNLVHRELMRADRSSWSSRRPESNQRSEFLSSTDSWFRPVMVRTAPDGSIWVADMYRLVIEHPEWITPERQAALELRSGHERGRIYRISTGIKSDNVAPNLAEQTPEQWVEGLASTNGWVRDMCQQLLIWSEAKEVQDLLRRQLQSHERPLARLHALATLVALGVATDKDITVALKDEHPGMRRWSVRCCESRLESKTIQSALAEQARIEADEAVILQIACTLGESTAKPCVAALAQIMLREDNDPWVQAACLSSIRQETVESLVQTVLVDSDQLVPTNIGKNLLNSAAAWLDQTRFAALLKDWLPADPASITLPPDQTSWWLALEAWKRQGRPLPEAVREWLLQHDKWLAQTLDAPKASLPQQQVALSMLGLKSTWSATEFDTVLDRLLATRSIELRSQALQLLGERKDARVPNGVVDRWNELGPQTRRDALETLLRRETWVHELLEAMESDRLSIRELGPSAVNRLRQLPGDEIQTRVQTILADVTISDRVKLVENYLEQVKPGGDATAGRILFQKHCATCHRLGDLGDPLGPDLAALTDKTLRSLTTAILDPNRAVEDKYIQYVAETDDGLQVAGIISEENSAGVTLTTPEGKQHFLNRDNLIGIETTNQSLMPEGLERELDATQLSDVLALIRDQVTPSKSFPGNEPTKVVVASKEETSLPAKHARIYGPSLVFEEQYGNLGFWSHPDDHAIWTMEVEQAGDYEVVFDYAVPDGASGDRLELLVGEQQLPFTVESSGSWDNYQDRTIGEISLKPGHYELIVRPNGSIKSALIDLRNIHLRPKQTP